MNLLEQVSELINAIKIGSNSTHPVIFGIGTVECIVAVVRAAQRLMQLQPLQRRLHAAVGLGETGEEGGRRLFSFLGTAELVVRAETETRGRK